MKQILMGLLMLLCMKAQADLTVTNGLKLWLKADSLALTNNAPVATWTDSSGNANDAVQATLTVQGSPALWAGGN